MQRLEDTLLGLAPGVAAFQPKSGFYSPRKGLAIYYLPPEGAPLTSPGTVLGEALAGRSGLGCTMLEGIPSAIPAGAVVIGLYNDIKSKRPDLLAGLPTPNSSEEHLINIGASVLITAKSRSGLVHGMQTLAMVILRHQEETIPAGLIQDKPSLSSRGIALELRQGEITPSLFFQIVSFISTFKANAIDWILPADFSSIGIRDLEPVIQVCRSFGIRITVRLPWLLRILTGELSINAAWTQIRSVARVFGATRVALDDPCPPNAYRLIAQELIGSALDGEVGLEALEVDAKLIEIANCIDATVGNPNLCGWHRLNEPDLIPGGAVSRLPLRIEIPAHLPGLSSFDMDDYFNSIDSATKWLEHRRYQDMMIAFRDIGISHTWQNLLPPTATGLICAWGVPDKADEAAYSFFDLLYGDATNDIIDVWESLEKAFPAGLSEAQERRLREIAYGDWPDSPEDEALIGGIDWQQVVENINATAEKLENIASELTRNKSTLAGSYLSLQMLAWLCRFSILMPEITRRRKENDDDDGRTEPIAAELLKGFEEWRDYLLKLQEESGFEVIEMDAIEAMGLRIKGICDGIFE